MTEAVAEDMHTYEVTYLAGGAVANEEVVALYWQTGSDGRGDDKRFVYFKDWRHRTVLALQVDSVVSVRMTRRAH